MTTYRANAKDNIEAIFDREGDALAKAEFKYPDMTTAPAGFIDAAIEEIELFDDFEPTSTLPTENDGMTLSVDEVIGLGGHIEG